VKTERWGDSICYLQNSICGRRNSHAKGPKKTLDSDAQGKEEGKVPRGMSQKQRDERRCQRINRHIAGIS
jgi:hypothetical protein